MRRFEFSEGTSNKFWEIEVSGSVVTTHWGRIGTDGQTKSKDLGSAEQADKEAEKQVSAKAKKGYVEVASGGAPAAAKPPATPAAAATAEPAAVAEPAARKPAVVAMPVAPTAALPDEDAFTIPSAWKARLHARRGGRYAPDDAHDVAKQLARARDKADSKQKKALARLTVPLEQLSEAQLVDIASAISSERSWGDDGAADAFVRALLGALPLPTAVRVYLQAEPLQRGWRFSTLPGTLWLRRAIAAADDATYEATLAEVRALEADGIVARFLTKRLHHSQPDVRVQVLMAYLFPTTDRWRHLPSGERPSALATCPALASEAATLITGSWDRPAGLLETLAVEHGAAAVPLIATFFDGDADAEKYAARVLLEMPFDASVAELLDRTDHKAVASLLGALVERYPRRTIRLAVARRARSALAPLLRGWLLQYPEAVDALIPELDADGRAAVESLREELANALPDADPSLLPPLFSDPPWKRSKGRAHKPLAVVEDFLPVAFAWTPADEAVRLRMAPQVEAYLADRAAMKKSLSYDVAAMVAALKAGGPPSLDAQRAIRRGWFHDQRAHELVVGLFAFTDDPDFAARLALGIDASDAWAYLPAVAVPAIAQPMLEALRTRTRRPYAMEWADRHPAWAARAWVPVAVRKVNAVQREAVLALRRLIEQGHAEVVFDAARHYGDHVEAAVRSALDADPLEILPGKVPKSIDFWLPAALPRPKLKGHDAVLSLEQLEVAAMMLAMSPLDDPYAGVEVLKETCEARSLADFSWALFEQWLAAGGSSKDGWAMAQLGLLGDDAVAGKLTPMIRRWPGESQHRRAVNGLDVLLAIGTDVALMHLNGIAQKVKFKGIKENAQERIRSLAASLGLTREQLADRLVPDLGLSDDGTLHLDYGPRQFVVGFDETLRPIVRDADSGQVRKSLPAPGAKDDPEKAPEAEATFKQLKKDVRTLARLQISRLETAMVTGRRWPQADFDRFLARHPLLVHLVRRLIWGVYAEGKLVASFRVAEDGSYADAEDEALELPEGQVGLLHPIDADADTLAAWGEVLSDYELLQPFQQLGRPVHALPAELAGAKLYPCDEKRTVPIGRVLGLLSRGWERGEAQDGGVSHWVSMPLPDGTHEVRIWLGEAGIWTGMGAEQTDDPSIAAISVVRRNHWGWREEGVKTLGALPASLMSEVLGTLDGLYAEA